MKINRYRFSIFFGCLLVLFVVGVSVIDQLTTPTQPKDIEEPVMKTGVQTTTGEIDLSQEVIIAPVSEEVDIVRYYYEAGSDHNPKALDYFEGVYRQSQGVDYGAEDTFEVLAALSGTVKEVKKDALLGLCVTIECENGVELIYQSLSDVGLNEGESIRQGALIGHSGHNIYEADLGNHVHFTIEKDGACMNPLSVYHQKVNSLK